MATMDYQRRLAEQMNKDLVLHCPICGAEFDSQGDTQKHLDREHPDKRPYSCVYTGCPSKFGNISRFKKHLTKSARHTLLKPVPCEFCGTKLAGSRPDLWPNHLRHCKKRPPGSSSPKGRKAKAAAVSPRHRSPVEPLLPPAEITMAGSSSQHPFSDHVPWPGPSIGSHSAFPPPGLEMAGPNQFPTLMPSAPMPPYSGGLLDPSSFIEMYNMAYTGPLVSNTLASNPDQLPSQILHVPRTPASDGATVIEATPNTPHRQLFPFSPGAESGYSHHGQRRHPSSSALTLPEIDYSTDPDMMELWDNDFMHHHHQTHPFPPR